LLHWNVNEGQVHGVGIGLRNPFFHTVISEFLYSLQKIKQNPKILTLKTVYFTFTAHEEYITNALEEKFIKILVWFQASAAK
jgi:hypothetical protein